MVTARQFSFAKGEIAPSIYGRVDLAAYALGLRKCRNFIVMRHGGAATRPGTTFVGEVKDSTRTVKLVDWVFNADQSYCLEFGHQYMRVHRNGAQVTEAAQNITAATQANPCVLTIAGHGYSNGDFVFVTSVAGMTQINNRVFKVAGVTANTFQLQDNDGSNINSTSYTAYASGGTAARIFQITTAYSESDLEEVQVTQSGDTMTIVHPSVPPRDLTRTGHATWSLATITFAPTATTPTNPTATNGTAGAVVWRYQVTTVNSGTYEESLPTAAFTCTGGTPTAANPNTLDWDNMSGAIWYNVYKETTPGSGTYGFIGVASTSAFADDNIDPDGADTPPISRNPFNASNDYPSTATYYQQRLMMANTNNNPEKLWGSKSAARKNFTISAPLQDDDSVEFTLAGQQVNEVRHMVDNGRLLVFTTGGVWAVDGNEAGILLPDAVNAKQHNFEGSSILRPLVVNRSVVYVESRVALNGSIVRALGYEFESDGYRGNELSILSSHLGEGYTLESSCYQKIPNSILWYVRSDGTLLSLTFVPEHQIIGWARHDTDGTFEQVCSVPEGNEDSVYVVVKRTINGKVRRYVERLATRRVGDIEDYVGMDCASTYDGWHAGATTMTMTEYLSGGWLYTSTLTLTASASTFTSGDVGNEIHMIGSDDTLIRFEITEYVSGTEVRGRPHKTVPASMRGVAISTWAEAVETVTGLWHLEGEAVSVLGDGFVVADPNDADYDTVTVTNGTITLERPYAVIQVGLPILADLETLDLDSAQGETLAGKRIIVTQVTAFVEDSRGGWVGPRPPSDDDDDPIENLREFRQRDNEGYDDPPELQTGKLEINIKGAWSKGGRVFIRQTNPLPLTILSVAPSGLIPYRG